MYMREPREMGSGEWLIPLALRLALAACLFATFYLGLITQKCSALVHRIRRSRWCRLRRSLLSQRRSQRSPERSETSWPRSPFPCSVCTLASHGGPGVLVWPSIAHEVCSADELGAGAQRLPADARWLARDCHCRGTSRSRELKCCFRRSSWYSYLRPGPMALACFLPSADF